MLEEILKLPEFPSSFNIEGQKGKYQNKYNGKLPVFFENKKTIGKADVIEIIRNKDNSNKEELLAVLFWGIYFKVMARSPKLIFSLIKFIESDSFEKDMNDRKKEILESENPSALFKSFDKELHLPGLGYAYFTKLFFFYREALVPEKQSYPILDKWLSNAWCALDGEINKNTEVFNKFYKAKSDFYFDGTLKRKTPEAYNSYIQFMNNLAKNRKTDVITLEEKLFGADLGKYPKNNPRNLYRNWAEKNNIPLKKHKSVGKNILKPKVREVIVTRNDKEISGPFHLKETSTYFALRIEAEKSKKAGYITRNGCLHVGEELKKLLEPSNLKWSEAKKSPGPENSKYQFENFNDCTSFLMSKNLLIE